MWFRFLFFICISPSFFVGIAVLGDPQLKYYKICNNKKKSTEKPYGIGVIKTYSDELETEVEKREFNHIFSKENDANNMLELLIRNKVTPITLKDILKDFVLV